MIALLTVPITALIAIWLVSTSVTISSAIGLYLQRSSTRNSSDLAAVMIRNLQAERTVSLTYLGSGRRDPAQLAEQRVKTDAAITKTRQEQSIKGHEHLLNERALGARDEARAALEAITRGRAAIDAGRFDLIGALRFYNTIIEAQFRSYAEFAGVSHPEAATAARPLHAFARAADLLAQQDAMLRGVVATGTFTSSTYGHLVQLIGAQRFQFDQAVAQLPREARDKYRNLSRQEQFARLIAIENSLLALDRTAAKPPPEVAEWPAAYASASTELYQFHLDRQHEVIAAYGPLANAAMARVALTGGAGSLAIGLAILMSIRIGRSLVNRLAGLRNAAVDLAERQLPVTVSRLRRGEAVDVTAEAAPLDFGVDEIGQVGAAFDVVRRTALASAVEESKMRDGMNRVFLNIARRNQTLLHRQLAVLDLMERRTTKPADLQDLFHVDHLAARMRRHAEDLVILAGSTPARSWRRPAPAIDLLRGAVSEIEEYQRVTIDVGDEASFHGHCALDLIHLLAELLENATSYSPPHTPVYLTGQRVPHGYVIEIEDSGIGLSQSELDSANQRLKNPPDFDPGDSERLGLFVVAVLASRHRVSVTLRTSAYGGVAAIVLVPPELVAAAAGDQPAANSPAPVSDSPAANSPAPVSDSPAANSPAPVSDSPAVSSPAPATAPAPARSPGDRLDSLDGLPRRIRQASVAAQRSPATAGRTTPRNALAPRGSEDQPADPRPVKPTAEVSHSGPAWNADTVALVARNPTQPPADAT